MFQRALLVASLVAVGGLAACDSDGDGLKNGEEKDLGYDPKNPDMDGDGLNDAEDPNPLEADADGDRLDDFEERQHGTDPNNPDTDGDKYLDGDEVYEGKDPADSKSKIYKAGWPYYFFKDDLGKKKWSESPSPGDKFPRHKAIDFNDEKVDLYDFGGPDAKYKYIVIDSGAEWCGPCNAMASWIAGGPDSGNFESFYGPIREAVDSGDVLWVEILAQDSSGARAGIEALERWENNYHHRKIPILADTEDEDVDRYINRGVYPAGAIIRAETMKVEACCDMYDAMDWLMNEL